MLMMSFGGEQPELLKVEQLQKRTLLVLAAAASKLLSVVLSSFCKSKMRFIFHLLELGRLTAYRAFRRFRCFPIASLPTHRNAPGQQQFGPANSRRAPRRPYAALSILDGAFLWIRIDPQTANRRCERHAIDA